MNLASVDALTRNPAGAVARRASIASLVALGLAPFTSPSAVEAKKRNSNKNKKAKKKCRQQIGQCAAFIVDACAGDLECLRRIACCELAGRCEMFGFLACI